MRELLLLASIIFGQLTPNTHFITQLENKLRLAPQTITQKSADSEQLSIITKPTKTITEDYTATAQAVYSIDLASNANLTSKNIDQRLQIASLTKLMTAYVILKKENLDRVLTVPTLSPQAGDSTIGLTTGEKLSVHELLKGLLITSGSDAAQTLAVGNAGSVDGFVTKMNVTASSLNLTNTHFANPVGWDNAENYSSAKDMTELTKILLTSDIFREIIDTKTTTIQTNIGRNILLETTNQLLYQPGYKGVKTGYTYGAGECLITLYGGENEQILTTVIGSSNRFGETDSIKGWILEHFLW